MADDPNDMTRRMTPQQRARYNSLLLAQKMGAALGQQLDRVNQVRRDPPETLSEVDMMLSGRQLRPTKNEHQPPHVIKRGPSPVPGGASAIYSNIAPVHQWPPAGHEIAPREPDQAPRVTIASNQPLPTEDPRPVYRMASATTVRTSIDEEMAAKMTPEQRAKFADWQQRMTESLQQRSDQVELTTQQLAEERQKLDF